MARLKGTDNVLRNLNKAIKNQRLATKAGLYASTLIVKSSSVKLTPIDWGNLRSSAFILVTGKQINNPSPSFKEDEDGELANSYSKAMTEGKGLVGSDDSYLKGIVVYSAHYSVYVHEMPASYNFNQGENQFLLKSLMKNQTKILKTLQKYAKV